MLASIDDYCKRVSDGYWASYPIWGRKAAASVTFGTNLMMPERLAFTTLLPSLPSGVTAYIPTRFSAHCSVSNLSLVFGKLVNLGDLDIATPTFTDGSNMGTATELGATQNIASAVFLEVTTVLNATPGNFTITYVDQDGNTGETSASAALAASAEVGSGGWVALNSPDWGARDITTATRTGGTTPTGVIRFWGMIPLGILPLSPNGLIVTANFLTEHFNVKRFGASNVLGGFVLQNSAAKSVMGELFVIGDN